MALKPRPLDDSDYWEGVADGMAEVAEQIGGQIRDGIAQAEAEKDENALDVISRQKMIEYLQGMARRLDAVSARVEQIVNGEENG